MRPEAKASGYLIVRAEESGRFAIPHPLQTAQRVGHPELGLDLGLGGDGGTGLETGF